MAYRQPESNKEVAGLWVVWEDKVKGDIGICGGDGGYGVQEVGESKDVRGVNINIYIYIYMRFSPLGGAYWEKLFYAKINLKHLGQIWKFGNWKFGLHKKTGLILIISYIYLSEFNY